MITFKKTPESKIIRRTYAAASVFNGGVTQLPILSLTSFKLFVPTSLSVIIVCSDVLGSLALKLCYSEGSPVYEIIQPHLIDISISVSNIYAVTANIEMFGGTLYFYSNNAAVASSGFVSLTLAGYYTNNITSL